MLCGGMMKSAHTCMSLSFSAYCMESWSASFNCSSSSLGSVGRPAPHSVQSCVLLFLSCVGVEERCMCGGGGEVHV